MAQEPDSRDSTPATPPPAAPPTEVNANLRDEEAPAQSLRDYLPSFFGARRSSRPVAPGGAVPVTAEPAAPVAPVTAEPVTPVTSVVAAQQAVQREQVAPLEDADAGVATGVATGVASVAVPEHVLSQGAGPFDAVDLAGLAEGAEAVSPVAMGAAPELRERTAVEAAPAERYPVETTGEAIAAAPVLATMAAEEVAVFPRIRARHQRHRGARQWLPPVWELGVLALILVLGAFFRFTGINWDAGQHLHPDERFLTMVEDAIRVGYATRVGQDGPIQYQAASLLASYFDTARSSLNPNNVGYGFYVYGTFPLFLVHALASAFHQGGYGQVHLFGRALSGVSDLVTVALVYAIGRRLYGARAGLLSAALVSFCVMHIQQAHFFVTDSFLITLIVGCFYFCVDIAETGRWRSFALAGLLLGLALATKLSMALFCPVIALAGVIYLWRTAIARRGLSSETLLALWSEGSLARIVGGGLLTVVIAALTFRVFQPYAFAGPSFFSLRLNPHWLDNIAYQTKTQSGSVDLPPSIQWAGTQPLLFPWRHMVAWGLGIPLGITAWVAFAAAGLSLLGRGRWQHLLVFSWTAFCFVYYASVLNKTMRYLLPMYPFILLLAGWALVALYDWTKRQRVAALNRLAEGDTTSRLTGGWQRLQPLVGEWGPSVAMAVAGFVVVASALWSFAFTRIYTRPTTRVAASEWIYANVPPGSKMANEHWDDPLPVNLPNHAAGPYAGPQLPLYDADNQQKIDTLVQMLTQSDYINITSNRLYGSIPRMPQRYPMAIEYYRRLFAGDLGFKLVHVETSYPQLGPWIINDDRAEEAFTVYDHPKVLIFQKQPDFSPEQVRQILSAVPLDNVQSGQLPINVGKPNLMMPDALKAANQAGGTWSDMFGLDSIENRIAPVLWLVALEALGMLAAPILWVVLHRLPDRGYGISKALGLLGVSWLAWTLAGYRVLPWTRLTIFLACLALGAASALVLWRRGAEWLAWLYSHRRLVLTAEAVFLGAFLLVLFFRAMNPDLWHPARGGEKPMEFSYLNAVIKTTFFPPYDPWFAGGYLNYYYFGYVLLAALIKLTGVMPSIGFNLSVAALYGLTAIGAFSFAYNLARLGGRPRLGMKAAVAAGIAGFFFVALAGNLDGFAQLIERLQRVAQVSQSSVPVVTGLLSLLAGIPAVVLGGKPLEMFDFWRSSRVIPNNTINEFPFWTFLFSDLHAHLISLPFQVTTLGVLLHLAYTGLHPVARLTETAGKTRTDLSRVWGEEGFGRWLWGLIGWQRLVEVVLAAWLVGALYVINTWEFPTYLLLAALTFLIAEFAAQRGFTLGGLARALVSGGAVYVLAKPLFRPFWTYNLTFYSSVTPWTQDKTRLDHYLIIHSVLVFGLLTMAVVLAGDTWQRTGWLRYLAARWRWLSNWDRFSELEELFDLEQRLPATGYLALFGLAGALVLACLVRGLPLIAFLVALLTLVAAVAWERRDSPALLLMTLMAGTGVALGIFVEFFALSGDIGRMNTVFKFYLQTWVLWGLVTGVSLAWMADRLITRYWHRTITLPALRLPTAPTMARGPLLWDNPATSGAGDGDGGDWAPAASFPNSPVLAMNAVAEPTVDRPTMAGSVMSGTDGAMALAPTALIRLPTPSLPWWGWAWSLGAFGLVLASLAYPLGATPARLADRFNPLPPTLDGMAYMAYATVPDGNSEVQQYHPGGVTLNLGNDYKAITWMLEHVQGSPVVLEASIPEYRWGARVAKYTGLPAVLGWRWHQVQQRGAYAPQVDQRLRDVQTMFNDPSPNRVLPLLKKYDVRYIFVGDLERAYFSPAGIAKFDQMSDVLPPVYQQDGVTIYQVLSQSPN